MAKTAADLRAEAAKLQERAKELRDDAKRKSREAKVLEQKAANLERQERTEEALKLLDVAETAKLTITDPDGTQRQVTVLEYVNSLQPEQ